MSGMVWQPIETAPKNVKILVYCPWLNGVCPAIYRTAAYHSRGRVGWLISEHPANRWASFMQDPTHGMPLPSAPHE